jgi:hypothetical protein
VGVLGLHAGTTAAHVGAMIAINQSPWQAFVIVSFFPLDKARTNEEAKEGKLANVFSEVR